MKRRQARDIAGAVLWAGCIISAVGAAFVLIGTRGFLVLNPLARPNNLTVEQAEWRTAQELLQTLFSCWLIPATLALPIFLGVLAGRHRAAVERRRNRVPPVMGDLEFVRAAQAAVSATPTVAGRELESCRNVLGVKSEATPPEIRRAFRKLILMHHPDRGGNPDTARRIIRAYHALRGKGLA